MIVLGDTRYCEYVRSVRKSGCGEYTEYVDMVGFVIYKWQIRLYFRLIEVWWLKGIKGMVNMTSQLVYPRVVDIPRM